MSARLDEIAAYLNELLRVREVPDWSEALNGLQVENRGEVSRIGAAVDASEAAIRAAAEGGCDLLLVHHGLFWDGNVPVTGRRYRRLRVLFEQDVAVYAAHLPLDVHPEFGNNALLARAIGARITGAFGDRKGLPLGARGEVDYSRDELLAAVEAAVGGRVKMVAGGPERVRSVGVVTGAGGGTIKDAIDAGLDALVTGEGPHHSFFDAMEGGISVYYAGHYATETFGVRALAEHLGEKFGVDWCFIDQPTGF